MEINDRTLQALGFDQIRSALANRARTELGRSRAQGRPFLPGQAEVLESLALVMEARALKAEPLSLPLSGLTDISGSLDRASKGGLLEPRELIAVTHVLFAFERCQQTLHERTARLPKMAALANEMPDVEKLATTLDRAFDSSGEISDRASPALKEARERARGLHRAIKARLEKMLHDEKFAANLREGYFSVRNDRYVVPVLSQSRAEVPGIVHNASQSGQTLFVEPTELIGVGNDLAIAQSVVLEEERQVLLDLSHQVGRQAAAIGRGLHATAVLDEAEAAATLANDLGATTVELQGAGATVDLRGLRHPLLVLQGTQVVPNEVSLTETARALVVSGPNAGGKTVTLTGVGLCALMVRAGLPIPVDEGSKLPLFDAVYSSIGDAQNLQAGLSTFSAHVSTLRDIVSTAKKNSLVLVDEIAADTDPREGAAIAIAVLEALLERGALVLVTTHLEELKALAHLDPRFVNARVGFDAKKMAPTFRLQLGAAGASSAIEIARRVGLPEGICARATDLAQNAGGALSKALAAAQEEQRRLSDAKDEAERLRKEAAADKERLADELLAFHQRRKQDELKFRESLRAELDFARAEVRKLLEQMKQVQSAKQLEKVSAELTARLNEQDSEVRIAKEALKAASDPAGPATLQVGAKAKHRSTGAEVEILEVNGDQVTVQAGALRMKVRPDELSGVKSAGPVKSAAPASRAERASQAAPAALTLAAPTLDVRGLRADEALRQLEQFLDRLAREGDPTGLVIHGHGTGALKASLREYLSSSPYASGQRPGDSHEGGDGVTVVSMR